MSYLFNEPDLESASNIIVRQTRTVSEHINYKQHFDTHDTSIYLMICLKIFEMLYIEIVHRNRILTDKIVCEK